MQVVIMNTLTLILSAAFLLAVPIGIFLLIRHITKKK